MSSRRQRERLRLARIEFDKAVDEGRRTHELAERINKMTKAQLIEYAEENGIEIDKTAKKAEILEKVKQ